MDGNINPRGDSMKTEQEKSRIRDLLERSGKKDIELRITPTELRIARKDDGSLPKIEGYAAVFNKDSEDMGFIERIAPGAFKKALKISDARALFNHDPNIVLGRQSAGTLTLKEDKKGLWMEIDPPDTQLVRDMVISPIERKDVREQSFGFTISDDEWKGLDTDSPTRTITEVREIYDTSPVTFAAYQDTTVALRSLDAAKGKPPEKPEEIEIVLKRDDKEDSIYLFENKEALDLFMVEASKRSLANPTIPADDNLDPDPKIKKDEETIEIDPLEDKFKTRIGELRK